ncbi:MAG: glycosyltransferase family 1 protein [Pseudomonadota bacterium]
MPQQPQRIALISEHASPLAALGGTDAGGQNVYVAHVARCLARAGHHVDVLTRRDAAHLPAAVDICPGMRVLHIDAGPATHVPKEALLDHMPAFAESALQLLQHSVRYDVVHANFFMSGLVGLKLRERLRVPLVVTFHALGLVRREHQGSQDTFPEARIGIERQIVRTAERIVAECPQDHADLVRLYGATPGRVATVPCGVDLAEFSPGSRTRARRALDLADDEFVVLQLGRLVPRKGIDNVIRAVACMRPGLRVRLLVVGGDSAEPDEQATPEIGRLRALAQRCGIAHRVTFTGHRQGAALRDCYVAADVFVSTPWYEPFGITPLEAMACARPVIGSAVGGIKFSVVDEVTGFLVPPRDPEALARRLGVLHDNPALAQALGRAGARRVRERFTWNHVSQSLLEVYDDARHAMAASRPPRLTLVRADTAPVARPARAAEPRVVTAWR